MNIETLKDKFKFSRKRMERDILDVRSCICKGLGAWMYLAWLRKNHPLGGRHVLPSIAKSKGHVFVSFLGLQMLLTSPPQQSSQLPQLLTLCGSLISLLPPWDLLLSLLQGTLTLSFPISVPWDFLHFTHITWIITAISAVLVSM